MKIINQLYTDVRKGEGHMSLAGQWEFCWSDKMVDDTGELQWEYTTNLPKSIYWSLYEAGVLPHPYEGCNSKQYQWVDQKAWYYRKRVYIEDALKLGRAVLCIDGAAYYSRIWINGTPIGAHEGMFGGPYIDIYDEIKFGDENDIIIECCAPNFGDPFPEYKSREADSTAIVPWNIVKDSMTSNGDFTVAGLWRNVRIEFLPGCHLARPQMTTKALQDNCVQVEFDIELIQSELKEAYYPNEVELLDNPYIFTNGLNGKVKSEKLRLELEIVEMGSDKVIKTICEDIDQIDYNQEKYDASFREGNFINLTITLENIKSWNPVGLGDPVLYKVNVKLFEGEQLLDELSFRTGFRMFQLMPTAGKKYKTRWGNYRFRVNGKDLFLKGVNWMPIDFLYLEKEDEYRWVLEAVRDAGIQLIRIWSGGGYPESDCFYDICDELGIMVWQDSFIANNITPKWQQQVLEEQVCLNLYRIRTHPSLVIHCGGNEFNPYAAGNAASMFVIERNVSDLDADRPFIRTTPDKGSAHIYRDMEPIWYRLCYKELPFVGESGIHSFPNARSIKHLICKEEYEGVITNMMDESFKNTNPELLNHFTEYIPSRVPRMMARASAITDLAVSNVEGLAEATQMASAEYYQIMIQSLRENYPVTGGMMLWVLKRPWTTVGIQLIDGLGEPIIPFYYVKNAYAPINANIQLEQLCYAAGEEVVLPLCVMNESGERIDDALVRLEVYNNKLDLEQHWEYRLDLPADSFLTHIAEEKFLLTDAFTDCFIIVRAAIYRENRLIQQSIYWPKCLKAMDDKKFKEWYRSEPQNNIAFDKGPWLKQQLMEAKRTSLTCKSVLRNITRSQDSAVAVIDVSIKNCGEVPAFPVVLTMSDETSVFRARDNYFFLQSGEERVISVYCKYNETAASDICIQVSAWNAQKVEMRCSRV